jgi:hypothetical protein
MTRLKPSRPIITITQDNDDLWRYTVRFAQFGPVVLSRGGYATITEAADSAALLIAVWVAPGGTTGI